MAGRSSEMTMGSPSIDKTTFDVEGGSEVKVTIRNLGNVEGVSLEISND